MARLADDVGTGTRKTLPTPKPIVDESTQARARRLADAQAEALRARTEAAQAQSEAATALSAAKAGAQKIATQLGGKVDPVTGKVDLSTLPKNQGGKKIVGYTKWTNPINGVTYNIPKYDDGTDASSEWTGGAQVPASFMVFSDTSGGGNRGGTTGGDSSAAAARLKAEQDAAAALEEKRRKGQSAFDLLFGEFDRYGMGALVNDVKEFVTQGLSRDELLLKLRATQSYDKRFAANKDRIKAGLRALSEAEYIGLEDAYQETMRAYGLPASYYAKGDMGIQPGFEKLIAGGVAPTELEYRIQTAYDKVINAAPEVSKALREFYPDINNGDILAFVLDPENARDVIKRKVTAAEIGAGAMQAGLGTSAARAEELQRFGVTGEQARQGYQAIGGFLPRATQLGEIYAKQGEGPFTQTTAEQEVFGTTGAVEAQRKRRKLAELEQAQFSGQVGASGGALSRERAGQF